ncbi:unnamed protein product [Moneuplotes crassus]|uniref:Uncharacterized protein n=2 Tax=Euplotes crassus TaxID=5936 RepID=A0AAD1ULA6_EUPCR|nr:unnamed protein product [Moneuplotes crassus]
MEYILKNMCDKSPYYQFDLPQLTDPVQNPQVQMMMTQKKPEVDNPGEKTKKKYLKHKKEVVSSDSSGYFNREDSSNMKKRELKDLLKNMQYSNSSNESKERRLQRESNSDSSDKLFKIQKVSKSREESLSCSNFDSKKDSQHKSSQPNDHKRKYSKDTILNIKKGSSIALLNKGKIIIQGVRIESSVPGEIQKYDKDLNVIIPDYPCQVYIEPLVLPNKPIRYEANLKVASKSLKEENKNPLMTTGSYSTNATSRRSYTQPSMFQDADFMKEMEILKNIFCCCVKR